MSHRQKKRATNLNLRIVNQGLEILEGCHLWAADGEEWLHPYFIPQGITTEGLWRLLEQIESRKSGE